MVTLARLMCRAGVVFACGVVAVGCDDNNERFAVDPDRIEDVDFVGVLVAADLAGWDVRDPNGRPPDPPGDFTRGGPDSEYLVGPATLELADGTVVEVAPATPGGTLCGALGGPVVGDVCVVTGAYEAGTTTAAWFATFRAVPQDDGTYSMIAYDFNDRNAVLGNGENVWFTVPLSNDIELVGCKGATTHIQTLDDLPSADLYFAFVDPEGTARALNCVYAD